ncbi:MAG: radical SAM protein [Candidatus Thorarchaeota archaeon]|nr:radical SAM protein [Candidatus Thorarchaeota archaeon]
MPPYISTYPRYIAGAIWSKDPHAEILYTTIDQVRESFDRAIDIWSTVDIAILIAGMIVPGKYIGGTPISVREARTLFSDPRLEDVPKILVGPWARYGYGQQGGKVALDSLSLVPPFDYVASGDPEMVIASISEEHWNPEKGLLDACAKTPQDVEEYAKRGARIVSQHPGFNRKHVIAEIETYRGCARFLTGGCSFCVEPLYGAPRQRNPDDVVKEIGALYESGVRAFRIGKQADLFVFGSTEMGEEEFPVPNPEVIESLFSKIRNVAPDLEVLHIDNVNPGTIAHYPEESKSVARSIIKYHTSGDVAAFGIESVDPEVVRRNNLKVNLEEALTAVRILNEVGSGRDDSGLPHLLPGINLLYGLPGESKRTIESNMEFLQRLVDEGLMVRRINIRQVIGFESTRIIDDDRSRLKRNQFFKHKEAVRSSIDRIMIQRVAPSGTIIRSAYLEGDEGKGYLLRPLGTYPLLCRMASGPQPDGISDVVVVDHGPRSLIVLPYPIHPNKISLAQWRSIPGIGNKRAVRVKAAGPLTSVSQIEESLDNPLPEWLKQVIAFS